MPFPRRTHHSPERTQARSAILFLSPYYLLTTVFFLYPLLNAAILAFYQTNGPRSRAFVGASNFTFLLHDPDFLKTIVNTTLYAVCMLAVQLPLALGLALLLNSREDRLKGFFRLVIFAPTMAGGVFVGFLFGSMFAPRFGLINRFSQALFGHGLEMRWLQEPHLVMPALVLASLWSGTGMAMIYFLAALQSVDRDLMDAASVDGAGRFQTFLHVTLPSIRHVALFLVIMTLIGAYQLFELPLILLYDGHGPQNAGYTIINYLNEVAFRGGDLGLGSAVGWVLAFIIAAISFAQLRLAGAGRE